jgi:DNA-binding MarR family transcriptional regulator
LCIGTRFVSAQSIYVRSAHNVNLNYVQAARISVSMLDFTANLLGAVGLAVADRIEVAARQTLNHAGETPAALVVIGYGFGPSNDGLRQVLGLSHPGTVRLIDRLVADGLVERRSGQDRRAVALYLTAQGMKTREHLLQGRLATLRQLIEPLSEGEQETLAALLAKVLHTMAPDDRASCNLCRLCDDRACIACPIPASFRDRPSENPITPPAAATPP